MFRALAAMNDYAIFKHRGLSPIYNQTSFIACRRVSPLTNRAPMLTSVPCALINKLKGNRDKCETGKNIFVLFAKLFFITYAGTLQKHDTTKQLKTC